MRDYENTITFLGQWGRFQQIIFFLLCASIVPNGVITFSSVFLADVPDHHCLIPDVNLTQDWCNATIPKEVIKFFEKNQKTKTKNNCYCTEVLPHFTHKALMVIIPFQDHFPFMCILTESQGTDM